MHDTHKIRPKIVIDTSDIKLSSNKEMSNGCTKAIESETSSLLGRNCSIMSLSVLPMLLFHKSSPDKVLKVYGMLDNCSQGSFIHQDVLENFDIKGTNTTICIKTMTGTITEESKVVEDFMVSDVNGINTLSLPRLFARKDLPINKDEIVKNWPHLESIVKEIPDMDHGAPVALLIGVNCPAALRPLNVINEKNNGPFAQRTALGWCIIGPISNADKQMSTLRCNRIAVLDSSSNRIAQYYFGVEEVVSDKDLSSMLTDMYKKEFKDPKPKDMKKATTSGIAKRSQFLKENANSKEDEKFLKIMENNVKLVGGHYELPLPFRNKEISMPNNREQAVKRAMWITAELPTFTYSSDLTDLPFFTDYDIDEQMPQTIFSRYYNVSELISINHNLMTSLFFIQTLGVFLFTVMTLLTFELT